MKPVPQREIGELAVSGPSVFRGYCQRPEETVKVLREGWLLTGDLAMKDQDGVIFIKGRKREMIKTGGVNVYPAEIEPVLEAHDAVVEAAVVGIPDKEWGEKVVACVIAKLESLGDRADRFLSRQARVLQAAEADRVSRRISDARRQGGECELVEMLSKAGAR